VNCSKEKQKILLIGTGGTIASEVGQNGLLPELTSNQLLLFLPDVSNHYSIDSIQPFNLDSTNITPQHWLILVKLIEENYDKYDGFVISHGTDTMAYTAAALSYLIQGSPKPIVLTGAQKPIVFDTTDSKINLQDAFLVAASGMRGVLIVFNGKVILGTRARKTHSKSFEAFSSINYPIMGSIHDGKLICYLNLPYQKRPTFYHEVYNGVSLLKLIPGTRSSIAEYMLQQSDALVIEGFGVGGIPSYANEDYFNVLASAIHQGKTVVITTQVANEGSDLSIYHVGTKIKHELPVLEAYDMTTEAVVSKLMWILGQTKDADKIRSLFYTPIANDVLV